MLVDYSGCDDPKERGPRTELEIIPAGFTSEAHVLNAKFGTTQDGTKNFLDVEFVLLGDHDFANRHVWTKCYLHKGANWKLQSLMVAVGAYNPNSEKKQNIEPNMAIGKQVQIVIDTNEYNGKVRNDVKYINNSRLNPPKAKVGAGASSSAAASGLSI